MDTKKILHAIYLHNLATATIEENRLNFEREVVQPFIDDAARMCILAAQAGQLHWTGNYMAIDPDKHEWFKEMIRSAFEGYGYKVSFLTDNHSHSIMTTLFW